MKKKILRIVPILLALCVLMLSVSGCKNKPDPATAQTTETVSVTTTAETTSQAAAGTETAVQETTAAETDTEQETTAEADGVSVTIDGTYTSKEEVAAYIHEFRCLPSNFITKSEAQALGWDSGKGNLWAVAEGKSIGGDRFGNYEGYLPKAKGRVYYECDIGYDGGKRGPERIVFSNDGLIYYTKDHYNTFELLYGEE